LGSDSPAPVFGLSTSRRRRIASSMPSLSADLTGVHPPLTLTPPGVPSHRHPLAGCIFWQPSSSICPGFHPSSRSSPKHSHHQRRASQPSAWIRPQVLDDLSASCSVLRPGETFRPHHHVQGCHAARRVSPRPQRSSLPRVPAPLPLSCPALTFPSSLSRRANWLPLLAGLDFEASILRSDAFTPVTVLPALVGRSLHSVLFPYRDSSLQPLEGLPPSHPRLTFLLDSRSSLSRSPPVLLAFRVFAAAALGRLSPDFHPARDFEPSPLPHQIMLREVSALCA
jgi:hypothetical protein